MPKIIDETGSRFGRLLVIEKASRGGNGAWWVCRCDCGNTHIARGVKLRIGAVRSCSCLSRELSSTREKTRHGLSRTAEYHALASARNRCRKPSARSFGRYGARGIEYRLPDDLGEATAMLIKSIGHRPEGMTLDRIDNNGHYEIGNLRWATLSNQRKNQSRMTKA